MCADGSVRFARYCGKMYSHHLFPYGGLKINSFDCQMRKGPADILNVVMPLCITETDHLKRRPQTIMINLAGLNIGFLIYSFSDILFQTLG